MNEQSLTIAILERWPVGSRLPRHITALQVNNGAGFSYSRKLDAVVLDTWPSQGLRLHGLEIKCTKADLRRELQDTRKFAEFAPFLDLFSIVAPKGIVDLKLLPPKWGLYCLTDEGKLRARRKPLMLHDDGQRKEISLSFMAAFVRALVTRSLSNEAKDAEYDRGRLAGEQMKKEEIGILEKKISEYKRAIEEFEEKSGVQITTWNAGRIGEAVQLVTSGWIKARLGYCPDIRNMGKRLIELADELDALSEDWRADDL